MRRAARNTKTVGDRAQLQPARIGGEQFEHAERSSEQTVRATLGILRLL